MLCAAMPWQLHRGHESARFQVPKGSNSEERVDTRCATGRPLRDREFQDRHFKNFASNVTDITESRAIVRSLFEMLVAENMTTYTTAAKLREQERATAEGQKKIRQLQAEFQQAREDYDMKLTNLLKEHQEEKLVFLKHSANATLQSNPDLDTSIVEKLEGQVQELSRLQYIHDQLKKKSKEVEALEMELASVKGGRVAFFEDVSPVKKPKKKPETSNTGNKMSSFTFADLDTTIDFDSDGENDQEMTPTGFSAVNDASPTASGSPTKMTSPKILSVPHRRLPASAGEHAARGAAGAQESRGAAPPSTSARGSVLFYNTRSLL
ncbi:uncharacterized protein LOC142776793 isoform X1 [Rhipicephalus microplus]|uniref:uncharacterized protein LOC142776793 isoform X1 n=2 Tax=Rhipicephalus microplus TaxID=6941 RepID=UPI003F6D2AEC